MSGTAAVGNTFASAVTATGLQLDNNFATVVAYLNDPTNRNNYAADAGATNTVVLTFAPPVVGGYTTGLELAWKWAASNTGGVVVNANGLGNASLVNHDGTALESGQGVQGSIGKAIFDGTRFIYLASNTIPATQAQMETATSALQYVSPARQQFHPSAAKAWASWVGTNTGTITANSSYNVTRIIRVGVGSYSIVLTTAFSSTAWGGLVTASSGQGFLPVPPDATACLVRTTDSAGSASDAAYLTFVAYGDQ